MYRKYECREGMDAQERPARPDESKYTSRSILSNYAINADSEKRRAFVTPLFTAGFSERWAV